MDLFGRRKIITTCSEINSSNVVEILQDALVEHGWNYKEEDYLYWYRRGLQPILNKTKHTREEINNKVVENHAAEIVEFKDGYFLTQPAFYKTRKGGDIEKINKLNDYLYMSGKHDADCEIIDWFHTVGIGVLYVDYDPETTVSTCALDPRFAFCIYGCDPKQTKLAGVHIAFVNDKVIYEVYTRNWKYIIEGQSYYTAEKAINENWLTLPAGPTATPVKTAPNLFGEIPIIEYVYNNARMGAFESVVPLLDAINTTASNRVDGIEQFINSLLVFYNCELGNDENGDPITPAFVRESGALFLKTSGDTKADLKEITSQLDQTQTQVLVDYMYQQVLTICGMPNTTKGGSSTSDTGSAVLLRDGWYQADAIARNTEDLFRKSNRDFDKLFIKVLSIKDKFDIDPTSFELQFPRTETQNLLSKTQGALNLKQLGLSPEITLAKSGISNDPAGDVEASREYIDAAWTTKKDEPAEMVMVEGEEESEAEKPDPQAVGEPINERNEGRKNG